MSTASLIFGIMAILGMLFGFIPCLGAFNWINIPLATIGLVISILAYLQENNRSKSNALAGIIMCAIAVLFGGFRLILGGGIL